MSISLEWIDTRLITEMQIAMNERNRQSFYILEWACSKEVRFKYSVIFHLLTLFRMGFFRAALGWGAAPLPNICHTYPTMMKLGTVISYLRKIQKMYKSGDTFLASCRHQHFFTGNQKILPHQEIHI